MGVVLFHFVELILLMVHNMCQLNLQTTYKFDTVNSPSIDEYTNFKWWKYVRYLGDNTVDKSKEKLDRWLGVSHRIV